MCASHPPVIFSFAKKHFTCAFAGIDKLEIFDGKRWQFTCVDAIHPLEPYLKSVSMYNPAVCIDALQLLFDYITNCQDKKELDIADNTSTNLSFDDVLLHEYNIFGRIIVSDKAYHQNLANLKVYSLIYASLKVPKLQKKIEWIALCLITRIADVDGLFKRIIEADKRNLIKQDIPLLEDS